MFYFHNKDDKKSNTMKRNVVSKDIFYNALVCQIKEYLEKDCKDLISVTGNCAALIFHDLREAYGPNATNWCGFYFVKPFKGEKHLVLGPFQGKPACNPIAFSDGVCGFTATNRKSTLVPDVHKFPNHIACDGASQSEIVVPVFDKTEKLVAVLDIDCPELNGFDEYDQQRLEEICTIIGTQARWQDL